MISFKTIGWVIRYFIRHPTDPVAIFIWICLGILLIVLLSLFLATLPRHIAEHKYRKYQKKVSQKYSNETSLALEFYTNQKTSKRNIKRWKNTLLIFFATAPVLIAACIVASKIGRKLGRKLILIITISVFVSVVAIFVLAISMWICFVANWNVSLIFDMIKIKYQESHSTTKIKKARKDK